VLWTLEGSAVVDGVAPSPYTDNFGSEAAMKLIDKTCAVLAKLLGLGFARFMHESEAADSIVAVMLGLFDRYRVEHAQEEYMSLPTLAASGLAGVVVAAAAAKVAAYSSRVRVVQHA
jgi:hypothetical protein